MSWTPPSDAVVTGGWSPPADAVSEDEEESGILVQAGKDAFGGIESVGRMLWNAPAGFVAKGLGSLTGLGMGEDLPQALERGDEAANRVSIPPFTKSGEVADQMLGEGYDIARSTAGDINAQDLTGLLDPKQEAKARSLGEAGFDALMFGGLLKGGLHGLAPKEVSSIVKQFPEVKGMTEAEAVAYLKEKSSTPPSEDLVQPTGKQEAADAGTMKRLEAEQRASEGYPNEQTFLEAEIRRQQAEVPSVSDPNAVNPNFGLEPKRTSTGEVIESDGLSKGIEYGFEKNREPIQGTDVPDTTLPEMAIQEPSARPSTIPYTNTVLDYLYSRFPELTERLQKDQVANRLMASTDLLIDKIKEVLNKGGKEFADGMGIKKTNIELMPDVSVESGAKLASSKRSQAELNRLKAEYEELSQRLDVTIRQLGNRLKSRSKGIGSDIANNAKFLEWVNGRLNSSGPVEGQIYTKGKYVEGSASANIKKSVAWGKKQGGVIHPDLLTLGVSKLIEKLGERGTLMKFGGTFKPTILYKALNEATHNPASKLVWLSPEQFLKLAKERRGIEQPIRTSDPATLAYILDGIEGRRTSIRQGLHTKTGLKDMPILIVDKIGGDYKITGHEGRHRMDVFKEQGMDKIPVLVRQEFHRGAPNFEWPDWVTSENGKGMEFPKPMNLSDKPMGQTSMGGSQRGGPKMEDPFKKFERELPAPYKQFAKFMWDDLQAKKAAPNFVENKEQVAAGEFIHDITDQRSRYVQIIKPWEEAKSYVMSWGKDIGRGPLKNLFGRNLAAGGKNVAMSTRHPLIKYVVDNTYAAKENIRVSVENALHTPDGIFTLAFKLKKNELISLMRVVNKYRFKEDLSPARLVEEGMNQKQIDVYKAAQREDAKLLNAINEDRIAHGQKPIERAPGYWGSNWGGDYSFEVFKKHSDGRKQLIRIEDGDWTGFESKGPLKSRGLKGVRERIQMEHPEWEVGPITQRARRGYSKEALQEADKLRDLVNQESPAKAELEAVFDRYIEELADKTKNFRTHFEKNTGVGGYLGDKYGKTEYKNAKDMLHSKEGYLRTGYHYLETKKAARKVEKALHDPDITKQYKNASVYAKAYWDKFNEVETIGSRAVNSVAETISESYGGSKYAHKGATGAIRHAMSIYLLGMYRAVFIGVQRAQSLQFGPAKIAAAISNMNLPPQAFAEVMAAGMKDRFLSGFGEEGMSQIGKEAMKYAKENRIVDINWTEDVGSATAAWSNVARRALTGEVPLKWADSASRMDVYMNFAHLFNKAGLKGKDAYAAAADQMRQTMVDYSTLERPMVYDHAGFVGDLALPLQTFAHNFYHQMWMYGKDIVTQPQGYKHAPAAMMFITANLIFAGMLGLPGREDADWLIDQGKALGLIPASQKNVTQTMYASSNKHVTDKTAKDALRYGALSAATGTNLSTPMAASGLIPDSFGEKFPYVVKPAEIIHDVMSYGIKLMNGTAGEADKNKAIKTSFPPAWKYFSDRTLYSAEQGGITNPDKENQLVVRRGPPSMTDPDWIKPMFGATPLREYEDKNIAWEMEKQTRLEKDRVIDLAKVIRTKLKAGEDASKEKEEYFSLGGTAEGYGSGTITVKKNEQITNLERAKGMTGTQSTARRHKLYNEMK